MGLIECFGRCTSINYFEYEYSEDKISEDKIWDFIVKSNNKISEEVFDFAVTQIENNIVKVTQMNHHNVKEFIAKGIPEAMIIETNRLLNKKIISSTNNTKHKKTIGEERTDDATKVWERLRKKKKAKYHTNEDYYELI